MKTTRIALLALFLGALAGAASASTTITAGIHIGPSGRAAVDIGFFYDDLAPYGNWVERPHRGWCWVPRHTSHRHWRPYQYGHWVLTDYGWTWVSDEPYGWATYHYGRWFLDPDYGWEWIPGNEWGPAWVSWQASNDYVGWAPLPPSAEFRGNYGVDYGNTDFADSLTPETYVFVPQRQFLASRVFDYVVPDSQAPVIYEQTRNYTNYRFENHRFINQGVPVERVRQGIGRDVQRFQIADLAPSERRQGERVLGNRIALFRPQVQRVAAVAPPPARPLARRAVMNAAAAATAIQANRAAHQQQIATRQQQRTFQRQQNDLQDQQFQGRQQQIAARQQQRAERQQADQRNQQAQERQQQMAARQQQRAERQQANQRNQQAQERQQQMAARQQQRAERQQANQRNQQAQERQQQMAARQQQRAERQQQAQNNRPHGGPGGQGQPQGNPHGNRRHQNGPGL